MVQCTYGNYNIYLESTRVIFSKTIVKMNGKTLRCNRKDASDECFNNGNSTQVSTISTISTIVLLCLKDSQVALAVILSKIDSYSYDLLFSSSNFGLDYQ